MIRVHSQSRARRAPRAQAAALLGVALIAGGCGGGGKDENGSIRISGNLELTEVKVAFKVSGKLIERTVDEGDRVEKDQVIARLDQEQFLRQKDEAQAVLAGTVSGLRQHLTAIEFQRETVGSQIAEREAQLRGTEAQLAELEAGSRTQEIEQAKARAEEAGIEFERALGDWDRAQPLFRNDDISRAQYDQYQARFSAAKAQLSQAKENLALVREGPRKQTIAQARARVEQARAAVRLAEAQWLEIKRKEEEVDFREAEIERALAQVALLDSRLADTVAAAPVSGTVLTKAAEVGEVLAAGATVVTIGDLEHPWLRGYIGEQDLGRVKLGARVNITTDSYPDKIYEGRVTFIASEAEFTPKQIQTTEERVKLVYRIKVGVDNAHRELKLNMPADGEIVVE